MIKIAGVRFRGAGKAYYFDPGELPLKSGDHVIVDTARGTEYGVVSLCREVEEEKITQPLKAVTRIATEDDELRWQENKAREREAMKVCREKIRAHKLEMKLIDAEYTFDNSKLLFYFTADGRVDFRDLVKDLASVFHTRIELRQIGVRDETRLLGGYGICGRPLCCHTWLTEFVPVSIRMAKAQNLSLNPTKISGVCGRLMCCLKNEEETYEYLSSLMPTRGEEVTTAEGRTGTAIDINILRQRVRVLFEENNEKEIEEYPVEELTFEPRKRKEKKNARKEKEGREGRSGREGAGKDGAGRDHAGKGSRPPKQGGQGSEGMRPRSGAKKTDAPAPQDRVDGPGPSGDRPTRRRRRGRDGRAGGTNAGDAPVNAGAAGDGHEP